MLICLTFLGRAPDVDLLVVVGPVGAVGKPAGLVQGTVGRSQSELSKLPVGRLWAGPRRGQRSGRPQAVHGERQARQGPQAGYGVGAPR
jgi:hypothetical protein